jgi:glycosyltransferase involved in cell wall biosynthesis
VVAKIMAALDVLFVIALVFLGVQMLTLLSNLFTFPVLQSSESRVTPPAENKGLSIRQAQDEPPLVLRTGEVLQVEQLARVSILIPARNEIENLPDTLLKVLQQPALEVIALDDESKDGTTDYLEKLSSHHPKLKVIRGQSLPKGWGGKNWACHQLSKAATGDILIFTDADVCWEKGTLESLLAFRSSNHAEFVSVWPRQLTGSWLECVTVPLIDQILLGSLPYWGVKYLPFAAFSAGNGQLMLWTREAYEKVGGHEALKAEVLEDVRMAQEAKRVGLKVALALGGHVISTRMYKSDQDIIKGFSKNIVAAIGNKTLLVITLLLNTLAHTLPLVFIAMDRRWLAVLALSLLQRVLTCVKTKRDWREFIYQPFMSYAIWRIGLRALRQKGYSWKERSYEA